MPNGKNNNFFKRKVFHVDIDGLQRYPALRAIITKFIKYTKIQFSEIQGIFMNLYENGNDYAPYHQDSYDTDRGLYTITLGGTRECLFKHNQTKHIDKYQLGDGDLFFFNNTYNNLHKHSIPKRKKMNDPRISILLMV